MASPKTLIPGCTFSYVNYYENDLLVPHVQTLILESKQADDSGNNLWISRELGENEPDVQGEALRLGFGESDLGRMLNYAELAQVIGELRQVIAGETPNREAPLPAFAPDLVLIERNIREWEGQRK